MQRFWEKVEKTENCWNWIAADRGTGYGCFKYKGKVIDAHRMVWFLTYGYFPKELVCHKCDNRKCVRPDHLFKGTHRDNLLDAVKKGRITLSHLKKYLDIQKSKTHCKQGHKFDKENT